MPSNETAGLQVAFDIGGITDVIAAADGRLLTYKILTCRIRSVPMSVAASPMHSTRTGTR